VITYFVFVGSAWGASRQIHIEQGRVWDENLNYLRVRTRLQVSGVPKALQNRAKLNPTVKTIKKLLNLGRQHPKMFGKKMQ